MKYGFFFFALAIILTPSVSFATASTSADLIQKYQQAKTGGEKVKVLIVPGHDVEASGTEFRGIKEYKLNALLADNLYAYFKKDKAFDVAITQKNGEYTDTFRTYFAQQRSAIQQFRKEHVAARAQVLESGAVSIVKGVPHNTASEDVSVKLFGINKWAGEHDIDLVIHIHFNDHGGRKPNKVGDYNGFTIYIPESQLPNAKISRPIAEAVAKKLSESNPTSNLQGESQGVTEEQDLIAIGSHSTLQAAAFLVEYAYIYEPQLTAASVQKYALNEYAYRTYWGVKEFFGDPIKKKIASPYFPYRFENALKKGAKASRAVFALQTALVHDGAYPASGMTLNDCPVSGNFGVCTELAVKEFQEKNGLPATGIVGSLTQKVLNKAYGK